MRLPELTELPNSKEMLEEFGGYNHNLRIPNSDWYDQKNMTADYYPVASPRNPRSIINPIDVDDEDLEFTTGGVTYYVQRKIECAAYDDDGIVSLHYVKKYVDNVLTVCGMWLSTAHGIVGGDYPAEIVPKLSYFNYTLTYKRKIVKMGEYFCVLPDGVVFERSNTTEHVPVHKIQETVNLASDVGIFTATIGKTLDGKTSYHPEEVNIWIPDNTRYRCEGDQIQRYLEEDGVWINEETALLVFQKNTSGTFGNLKIGDVVTISYTAMTSVYGGTSVACDAGLLKNKTARAKIKDKYTMAAGSHLPNNVQLTNDTDVLVFDGFVNTTGGETHASLVYATGVKVSRDMPKASHISCVCQNRIWTCSGNEIFASAQANPYNFYDYSGIASDSVGFTITDCEGDWTGCCSYQGQPIFFKEHAAVVIGGSYATNLGNEDSGSYYAQTINNFNGVERGSADSFAIINNILYYKGRNGIVAYDGSSTALVSSNLGNIKYTDAIAGATNDKYYVSLKNGSTRHLFVYNTRNGYWNKEDNLDVDFALAWQGYLLFCAPSIWDIAPFNTIPQLYYIMDVAPDDENVNSNLETQLGNYEWMCETGDYGYSYPNNKYISRLQVRLRVTAGATAAIYIQYDSDGVWNKIADMSNKGTETYLLPIVPIRCDHLKLQFKGKGDVKIISIAKILEEGGDA